MIRQLLLFISIFLIVKKVIIKKFSKELELEIELNKNKQN